MAEKSCAQIKREPLTEGRDEVALQRAKHGLQDKQKKTIINADDNLRAVFDGKTQVTMFEMTKLVSAHVS